MFLGFFLATWLSSTNKTDWFYVTEILQNMALNTNNINSVTFDPEIHDFTPEFDRWFFPEILKGTVPVLMHYKKKIFSFVSWVVYKRIFFVVYNYRTMIYPVIIIVHLPLWTIYIQTHNFHSNHPILWYKCITYFYN